MSDRDFLVYGRSPTSKRFYPIGSGGVTVTNKVHALQFTREKAQLFVAQISEVNPGWTLEVRPFKRPARKERA